MNNQNLNINPNSVHFQSQINSLKQMLSNLETQVQPDTNRYNQQTPLAVLPQNFQLAVQDAAEQALKRLIGNAGVAIDGSPLGTAVPSSTPLDATKTATPQLTPMQQLEQQINQMLSNVLTPEHQDWLSDKAIYNGIPLFLRTPKGKDAVALLVEEYKSYVEGK